jgi:hypothetical protein
LEASAASALPTGPAPPVDLDLILKGLGIDCDAVKHRVDSLEARMETNQAKIKIAGSQSRPHWVLHSSVDLRGYLAGISFAGSLNFGRFADVYTFLAIIEARQHHSTLEQMVKIKKDVKTLGLSYAEACVVHTHTILIPGIFGEASNSPSGSTLTVLPNYEAWRNMTKFTGLSYVIEQALAQVYQDIANIIQEEFTNHRTLFEVHVTAYRIALNSQAFLTHLIRWVDDTYMHLIASGNTKDSEWWVITSFLKEIFREYMWRLLVQLLLTSTSMIISTGQVPIFGVQ